ncbi:AcrR family transcriptional regulator [Caulobacter ginsengisoli]|uniref:AcrR family transcriptional regulator n=1 Tax=Caulobacter ginsengisoli TaxID=400775 RepID=A0ABU0IQ44_9CAUL|nr:TetR/AcrR family transcriptional regulator [Caulobacter ginsengisoli]MDQ0464127.1 AcrR family transcriptional regulator [Caulobacter ginsengisoli]
MTARPARDTYRHGNLREAALAAARAMVETGGHEALSLRKVAQAAGVAHRSLYGQFEGREALLDAVAQAGFEDLAVPLAAAASRADFVEAYVRFALANPRLYDLMRSRPHATMKFRPSLQKAVHLGITQAMRLFADPAASKEANRRAVMKVLILLHGGIAMHRSGILDLPGDEGLIAELQAMMG